VFQLKYAQTPVTFADPGEAPALGGKHGWRWALINVSKIGSDSYVVDMTIGTDSISVRVSVPKSEGARIFSDAERERAAYRKAQEIALDLPKRLQINKRTSTMPIGPSG
jgi:hypothetical protein